MSYASPVVKNMSFAAPKTMPSASPAAKKMIWISAGEASGDMHGALLLKALATRDPSLSFVGMGGPALRASKFDALFRAEDLSVMGVTEVLGHLPRIFSLLSDIKKALARVRPAAIVVIDAPDFHFRVISAARLLGIPVYYYISPKIWAWRQSRAGFIRKNVRRMISILPFEVEFYRRFGMDVEYVGNPLMDLVNYPALRQITPRPGLVGFLPGSRNSEISRLLPAFAGAARILRRQLPHLSFACVRAPNVRESRLRALWPEDVPVEFIAPDNRWAFMRGCEMLIAASGTVTLESAIAGTPTLVTYKLSPLSALVGRALIKVPFISLPNLVAGRGIFPELLQKDCDPQPLAAAALAWLLPAPGTNPLERVREELDEVRNLLGEPGAPERAAKVILEDLRAYRE